MSNDRNHFVPEVRNAAWWSGDTRLAASGRANEVILQKLGMMDRPDLSDVEAVQMGHVMQPVIGRLAQDRLKMELKDADYALTHRNEPWLKSHFDFISSDGKTLVEAKNYGNHNRNKFDTDSNIVPPADMAQLIHECTVHNVSHIVLAVLFGGQEFCTFSFTITDSQKEELIRDMAEHWSRVVTKSPLPPETVEQAKVMYRVDSGNSVMANPQVERACARLKAIKDQIKALEDEEEQYQAAINGYMGANSELITPDGKILATWKASKASKRFDAKLFQSSMPDIYQQFVVEAPGSRRFLVK
jgi:predicted phage-related endonuclease